MHGKQINENHSLSGRANYENRQGSLSDCFKPVSCLFISLKEFLCESGCTFTL